MLGELPRNQIENVYESSRFQMISELHSDHTFQSLGKKKCVCVSKFFEIKILFNVLPFYRFRTAIISHVSIYDIKLLKKSSPVIKTML